MGDGDSDRSDLVGLFHEGLRYYRALGIEPNASVLADYTFACLNEMSKDQLLPIVQQAVNLSISSLLGFTNGSTIFVANQAEAA